jgi:N-acetylneuraminic acid mutarotase
MAEKRRGFYFDKLDLFNNIRNLTEVVGVDQLDIAYGDIGQILPDYDNPSSVLVRLENLEQGIININSIAATIDYVDTELAKKVNKLGDSLLGNLELLVTPTNPNHLVTKDYVDNITDLLLSNLLALETLVNSINSLYASTSYVDTQDSLLQTQLDALEATVTSLNSDPVTKSYVDARDATKISKSGDTMSGALLLASEPLQPLEAASKSYVDSVAAGIGSKAEVSLLADFNITGIYDTNSITASVTGSLVIDGKTPNAGDIVLLTSQTDPAHNGSYIVINEGSATSNYLLERDIYGDESAEIPGRFYFVKDGDVYKGTGWVNVVSDPSTFVLGTDPITVVQTSGEGSYKAGNGLSLTGTTFSLNIQDSTRLTLIQNNLDLAVTGIVPGTYDRVEVDLYGRVINGYQNTADDIPDLDWSKITTGKPITLAGYGITDAVNKNGDSMVGYLTLNSNPVDNLHAAPKQYVDTVQLTLQSYIDTQDASLQNQIDSLNSTVGTLNTDPVTKTYVDTQDATKVNKAGDILTGFLTLHADPTDTLHAVTKQYTDNEINALTTYVNTQDNVIQGQIDSINTTVSTLDSDPVTKSYVDAQDVTKVNKAGDTMSGSLLLASDPVQPLEATTKQYVDNIAKGLKARPSVRVATTVPLSTSYNATSQELISNSPELLVIDGITPVVGDRVLIKDQVNASENGPYIVENNDGSTSYRLKRGDLFNESTEVPGTYFFVIEGTENGATSWVAIVSDPSTFTLDTDSVTFTQVNKFIGYQGSSSISIVNDTISVIASTGLEITPQGLSIKLANSTLVLSSSGLEVNSSVLDSKLDKTGGSLTGFLTLHTDPIDNLHAVTKQYVDSEIATLTTSLNNISTNLQAQINNLSTTISSLNADPVTKTYVDNKDATKLNKAGDTMSGALILYADPSVPNEATTKNYVDNLLANIDISTITTGTLNTSVLPAFNGDVYSSAGTSILTLSVTGVTPGVYSKVTVDAKGRITFGDTIQTSDLPPVDWNTSIINKPTTALGFGLTDVVLKAGSTLTGYLELHADPVSNMQPTTKQYVDTIDATKVSKAGDTMTGQLKLTLLPEELEDATNKDYVDTSIDKAVPVGTMILSSQESTPEGYLRCNGSLVRTNVFRELYETLKYKTSSIYSNGKFWEQQWLLNRPAITRQRFYSFGNSPQEVCNNKVLVIDNERIIVLGGYTNDKGSITNRIYRGSSSNFYSYVAFTRITDMPVPMVDYEAIYYNGYVYLIGGYDDTNYLSSVYRAKYNKIVEDFEVGPVGTWEYISTLPYTVSDCKAIVIKDYLYVIGGQLDSNTVTDYVIRARIFENGDIGNWLPSGKLPQPVRGFGLALTRNRVYILGGNTAAPRNTYIPVKQVYHTTDFIDWKQTNDLPTALCCMNVIVSRNIVTLLQCRKNNGTTRNIYNGFIDDSGIIGPITRGPGLTYRNVSEANAFITGNVLITLGGAYSNGTTDRRLGRCLYYNTGMSYTPDTSSNEEALGYGKPDKLQFNFNDENTDLGLYSVDHQLPIALRNSSSFITNNRLFILGFIDGSTDLPSTTIYEVPINNDSTLGTPAVSTITMPQEISNTEIVGNKNFLFMLGGKDINNNYLNTVYKTYVFPDGSITSWWLDSSVTLPTPISDFTSIIIKDKLYIFGGIGANGYINEDILMATVSNEFLTNFEVVGKLPLKLTKFKVAVINDRVVIFGGLENGKAKTTVFHSLIYKDGTIGLWNSCISLPMPYFNYQVVTSNNNIFLIDGESDVTPDKNLKAILNPNGSIKEWVIVDSGTPSVINSSISVARDRVYSIGGINTSTLNNIPDIGHYEYVGGRNNYRTNRIPIMRDNILTPYPYKEQSLFNINYDADIDTLTISNVSSIQQLTGASTIVTNSKVYMIGGKSPSGPLSSIDSYNIDNGSIFSVNTTTFTIPVPLYNHKSIVLGDMTYIIGGNSSSDSISEANVYVGYLDSNGGLMSSFALYNTLPTPINNFEVIYTSSKVYLLGGRSNGSLVDTIYYADITSDNTLSSWSSTITLPEPLSDFKTITLENYVYLIGGTSTSGPSNKIYRAKVSSNGTLRSFELYALLPIPITNFELISTEHFVFLIGGISSSNVYLDSIYSIPIKQSVNLGDVSNGNLSTINLSSTLLPTAYSDLNAIITSNKLYLFNGYNGSTTSDVLETTFKGGYDDYFYRQSLIDPVKFRLPDASTLKKDTEFEYYIKY